MLGVYNKFKLVEISRFVFFFKFLCVCVCVLLLLLLFSSVSLLSWFSVHIYVHSCSWAQCWTVRLTNDIPELSMISVNVVTSIVHPGLENGVDTRLSKRKET